MPARGIRLAATLLAMAWPLLVLLLHDTIGSWPLLLVGVGLLAWRLPQARPLAISAALLLITLGALGHAELGMRAYPLAVNLIMLLLFSASLWRGMPIIEQLARLREPELSPSGVRYTRRVTLAWCGFFIINGSFAGWTAIYADLAIWTLYNGVISYVLIALMFSGEWLIRRRLRRTMA